MKHRPLHIGEQLELKLSGIGLAWREPWEGRSPRELTKVAALIRLRPRPPGGSAGICSTGDVHNGEELQGVQLLLPFIEEVEDG